MASFEKAVIDIGNNNGDASQCQNFFLKQLRTREYNDLIENYDYYYKNYHNQQNIIDYVNFGKLDKKRFMYSFDE